MEPSDAAPAFVPAPNPYDPRSEPVLYWHHEGYAPSQIAAMTGSDENAVRRRVAEHWRRGGEHASGRPWSGGPA